MLLKTTVFVFVAGFVVKELLAAQVDVRQKEIMALPGENATFICRVAVPLQYCRIEIPGFASFNLNKGTVIDSVSYFGAGLDAGECGFTIKSVQEKNNGNIKCTLGISSESVESIGTMQLIVAKAPRLPELDLRGGRDSVAVFKVNDVLEASCIVKDGRPAANISWYLDDQPITDNLIMPTVVDMVKENLQSKLQNLTRTLQASDNGKHLRCVASHPAYRKGFEETSRQLDVKFGPLPIYEDLDKFGYQIGAQGLLNLTIEANPKPQIQWDVGGERILENSPDNSGKIVAEPLKDLGRAKYLANLRIAAITKADTEKLYSLTAYNDLGSQTYEFRISTSSEPEGLELGIGAIIGIVVVILFVILLVSMLIFAKATGRWCFSGGSEIRNLGECSDTESVEPAREAKRNIPPIKFTAFFKKNKDKVSSEDELETKRIETEESKPLDADKPKEKTDVDAKEGLVYAELDLVRADMKPVVKNDEEKTEYAEIVYTANANEEESGQEPPTK